MDEYIDCPISFIPTLQFYSLTLPPVTNSIKRVKTFFMHTKDKTTCTIIMSLNRGAMSKVLPNTDLN